MAKPIFAAANILVRGTFYAIGDKVETDPDDADGLVRMGRCHDDPKRAKDEAAQVKAAADAA